MELPKTYNPKDVEGRWYSFWEEKGYFTPTVREDTPPFVIAIPPPNVTGILHMGHGLNNTIQDILIRWYRMKGIPTLWVPGTDHAGIATQNVVEKKLHRQHKTRHDLGKEKFVKEVWKWKEEHGSTIIRQLKRLGCSCDWTRERFTMDEGLSRAVREAFVSLYEKGLIYRGYYIVNWCPRCHTALSDEEAAHKEIEGKLYYLKYPIGRDYPDPMPDGAELNKDYIIVATTRPETMLGDTGVAVNPNDERYKDILSKEVILPLLNRPLTAIQDPFVDPEFGTGIVKVTPAHDPNDFEMGRRHGLLEINILNIDGTINENGGPYKGLDRFKARKKIVEDLKKKNLYLKEVPHQHAVGHCYRCNCIIEPYLSKQWFVKMAPLAEPAMAVVQQKIINFVPSRWFKVYQNWMENIRDWCISRQIWWGHPIPVWYCDECSQISVSREDITKCLHCGSSKIQQDPDVLDTWFSSWLWPFSTLGWPDNTKDLDYFYPTTVLSTAPEILFFWVARMIMAGLEFVDEIPFHTVYLHGTVRDETGKKMSKSLGNSIDPLDVIDKVGADALRFVIISLTAQGQDVYLSEQKFLVGRNFTNKIWNAARFSFMNLKGFQKGSLILNVDKDKLLASDCWIVNQANILIESITNDLSKYRFNDACNHLYAFIWNDFCDWYLELSKPVLYGKRSPEERRNSQEVIFYVWTTLLKLLHPFMPHITEELWQRLKEFAPGGTLDESIMISSWPTFVAKLQFPEKARSIELLKDIVIGIREKRSQHNISHNKLLRVILVCDLEADSNLSSNIREIEPDIIALGKIEKLDVKTDFKREEGWVPIKLTSALKYLNGFVYLGDVVDFEKEKARLSKEKERIKEMITRIDKKLKNENFIQKAPPEVVSKEEKKLQDFRLSLTKVEDSLSELM